MGAAKRLDQERPLTLVPRPKPVAPMPRVPRASRTGLTPVDPHAEVARLNQHLAACFEEIRALRQALAGQTVWRILREVEGDAARFEALQNFWREDVAGVSDLREIVEHPAYSAIIAMGPGVVPWILRDLAQRPGHWHVALRALTGEQPVSMGDAGRLQAIREQWLAWGRAHQLVA